MMVRTLAYGGAYEGTGAGKPPHSACDVLSEAVEYWLASIYDQFWCEIANHGIGSTHACKYPSMKDAEMAKLRLVYLRGRADALQSAPDFEADLARMDVSNRRKA